MKLITLLEKINALSADISALQKEVLAAFYEEETHTEEAVRKELEEVLTRMKRRGEVA